MGANSSTRVMEGGLARRLALTEGPRKSSPDAGALSLPFLFRRPPVGVRKLTMAKDTPSSSPPRRTVSAGSIAPNKVKTCPTCKANAGAERWPSVPSRPPPQSSTVKLTMDSPVPQRPRVISPSRRPKSREITTFLIRARSQRLAITPAPAA